LKEASPKTQLGGSRNLQVAQGDRRYLPQALEGYLSDPRAHSNIFPPSSRTRKRLEPASQTIHIGGSSSIIFLVLALLCFLGLIFFTQKVTAGTISMMDPESNEVKRVVASATPAVEYFGEE